MGFLAVEESLIKMIEHMLRSALKFAGEMVLRPGFEPGSPALFPICDERPEYLVRGV